MNSSLSVSVIVTLFMTRTRRYAITFPCWGKFVQCSKVEILLPTFLTWSLDIPFGKHLFQ